MVTHEADIAAYAHRTIGFLDGHIEIGLRRRAEAALMFFETVRLALLSVRRNVLRSFLTLLGIVIGVAAVIAMITIGSGTTEKVKSDISKLGSNLLVVRAGTPARAGQRAERGRSDNSATTMSTPSQHLTGARAVSAASQKQVRVVFGTESLAVGVTGTDTGYFVGARLEGRLGPRVQRVRSPQRRRRLPARRDRAPAILRRRRSRGLRDPRRQDELPRHRPARSRRASPASARIRTTSC